MRGPLVYCLEGQDIDMGYRVSDLAIPADIEWKEVRTNIAGHDIIALEGEAVQVEPHGKWNNETLYRELWRPKSKNKIKIRLIPYYAWDNRGVDDMSVWMNRRY
jgi:hypothetical protein